MKDGHLYFHSPCFDGIVSAVLIGDFFRVQRHMNELTLHGVNYHLRHEWLDTPLEQPAIIVDFLYHPAATFWADHHPTTFLTSQMRSHFERHAGKTHVFDASAKSCARLLWDHLQRAFNYRNARFEELVRWADKTDSAGYESPEEAVFGDAPALRIVRGLGLGDDDLHCQQLVRLLHQRNLAEVADLPAVRERYEQSVEQTRAGLQRFKERDEQDRPRIALSEDGIAVFNVDGCGVNINRYAPFHFFPQARYSVGIVRSELGAKITAMRNPWMDFQSVPLGTIFEKVGGGGHQRVGSVLLARDNVKSAEDVRDAILAEIQRAEQGQRDGKES